MFSVRAWSKLMIHTQSGTKQKPCANVSTSLNCLLATNSILPVASTHTSWGWISLKSKVCLCLDTSLYHYCLSTNSPGITFCHVRVCTHFYAMRRYFPSWNLYYYYPNKPRGISVKRKVAMSLVSETSLFLSNSSHGTRLGHVSVCTHLYELRRYFQSGHIPSQELK